MSWPFTWAPSLGVAGVVGEIQGDGGVKGDHGSQGGEELRPEALAVAACHLSGEQCGKSSLLTDQPEGPDNDYAAENDQDGGGEILQEADGPAAVVADVEIDEYKQAEAEEAVERQTGVGREDDGDDGVQSCAADPVLNPEPQAAHEGTDDGGNGRALGSEYHLGQDGKTGAVAGAELSQQDGGDEDQRVAQHADKQRLIPG